MTQFKYYPLSLAQKAKGAVVVIDVLRAFTTAAYAFSIGVKKIYPVETTSEALRLKKKIPGSLVMGEEYGNKPQGFDFGNSPEEVVSQNLSNKTLIQRTSAGTQGLVRSKNHQILLAVSFVVAKSTAEYLRKYQPELISFIVTGKSMGRDGDEDRACAEYIAGLIQGKSLQPEDFTSRILKSSVGKSFTEGEINYLCKEDIAMSSQANIFDFIMLLSAESKRLVMKAF